MRVRGTRGLLATLAAAGAAVSLAGSVMAATPADTRLSNDYPRGGYASNYTVNTGRAYTDDTLAECSRSRGRQNEPSVAVDPRNTRVIVGSSNDYCGVYNDGEDANGAPIPSGPIWLGYYRSQNSGETFTSSLVPGYPDDHSPYRSRAHIRTATAGDPVLAWDADGRLFAGAEASEDPAGTKKTFGDVWVATYENPAGTTGATINDGKEFKRSVIVARGTSAPNLLGKFNDKTSIEADRTQSACRGNVYFAFSRFSGNAGGVQIQFARSTDHGRSFTHSMKVSAGIHDVQFPDIAVTANGHVYVTFRQFQSQRGHQVDALVYVKSTDCGATFSSPRTLARFLSYDAQDVLVSGGRARDCGDSASACKSGYTFFRRDTQVRATADQLSATGDESVYVVYDPSIPGTETPTGTTYGSIRPGTGSQSGIYFLRLNGATGSHTTSKLVDASDYTANRGHQLFPDVSADGGVLHVIWYDSRNDACYSRTRPVGNCANRSVVPSLDVYGTRSTNRGDTFAASARITEVKSNPNYEQFAGRTVPFAGDYIWVSSVGDFSFGAWTDWRNTVAGADAREGGDSDADRADVKQCRAQLADGSFTGDTCPRAGGLDQNIYGDQTP